MIENYCMKVVQFLNNKEEIKKEVEVIVYEMLEDKFGEKLSYTDDEITVVLKELGSPYILAMKYTNLPKVIVSEKNIYKFYYIYAIILLVIGVSFVFSVVFNAFTADRLFVFELFDNLSNLIVSSLVSFAILAIVFMLMEHYNKEIKLEHNPSKAVDKSKLEKKLKEIKKKKRYSLSEQIAEIFFITVFLIFITFFISLSQITENGVKILIFNEEYIKSMLVIINLIGAIAIIFSIYRIVSPKKTVIKELVFYGFEITSTVIYSVILLNLELFTESFVNYIKGFEFINKLFTKYDNLVLQVPIMGFIALIVIFETIGLIVNLHRIIVTRYDQ